MRRIGVVVTVLATASLAAAATGTIVKVGPRANGTTVNLALGDGLAVLLPGNATTGFAWRLRAVDRKVLKLVSSRYLPRKSGSNVGSGGTFVLRFGTVHAGATRLRLAYSRAGSTSVAKTFAVRVLVVKSPPPV